MDEELRLYERAALRLGHRFAAMVTSRQRPPSEHFYCEQVTLVGLFGHEGCLLWQGRQHYWLVPIHTVAALAELEPHLIYDMTTRSFVRPTGVTYYLHDLEVGWTELTDRPKELAEARRDGSGNSEPYRTLGQMRGRASDYRGPMHEEIDRCQAKFVAARAKVMADELMARGVRS